MTAHLNTINKIHPDLNHNGDHLERRKMYLESPNHNLVSHVDFTWEDSPRPTPRNLEAEKIRRLYHQRVQAALRSKYRSGHIFSIVPTEALNQQIEHFNQSKIEDAMPSHSLISQPVHTNQNQSVFILHHPTVRQSLDQFTKNIIVDNIPYSQESVRNNQKQPNMQLPNGNDLYEMYQINNHYARLNHLLNGDYPRDYTYRKAVPDRLGHFLRDAPERARVMPIRMSYKLNAH